jgi:hypothetical protein
MIRWHQIDKATGTIRQTVTASNKAEAVQLLGGGMVVSAASWKLDIHKYQPIKTVVTDIEQDQHRKSVVYFYKKGYRTVLEIARDFDARENQIRHIIDDNRILSISKSFGGRKVRFFSPASVKRIEKILDSRDPGRRLRQKWNDSPLSSEAV